MTTALFAPTGPIATVPPPGHGSPLARRAALGGLLTGTAVLYLWGLSASGWANAFYAAAAQAGSQSWEAWFFGSSDAANSITVDKPPASLWITGLSVRIFGLSSWSILVPEALMGVGAVWLLYATVRRTAGHAAGLLAAGALALTPVAVLMFRYNNPDALLVLLLIGSAYATLRAVESGRTRWLLLAGALIGFGFLTKMLQAFLVLPALSAAWMIAAPVGIGRRIRDLALAGVAMLVTAGWWVLVVDLWPADARPYIGGSQDNNVLELVFGYNGFGRLTGNEVGSVGGQGGAGGAGRWGETGLTRLFNAEMGGQAAWLLPAALLLLLALLWYTRRAPRTDHLRAATIVWGGWLLVTGLVFSLMAGIFHSYYLVALAPAIAAVAGIGAVVLWRRRAELTPRITLAVVLAGTAVWAFVLLGRTPDWQPWLAWTVLVVGVVAAFALIAVNRLPRTLGVTAAAVAVVVALAGPAGYSVVTAATPHSGAIPTAGPEGSGMRMAGGRGGGGPTRQPGTGSRVRATGHRAARGRRARAERRRLRRRARCERPGRTGGARRRPGRWSRGLRRPARRNDPARRRRATAGDRRKLLQVGGGGQRLQQRRRLPARHRRLGDARRGLQRHRPLPDARTVPAARRGRADPLLHRRRHDDGRRLRERQRPVQADL